MAISLKQEEFESWLVDLFLKKKDLVLGSDIRKSEGFSTSSLYKFYGSIDSMHSELAKKYSGVAEIVILNRAVTKSKKGLIKKIPSEEWLQRNMYDYNAQIGNLLKRHSIGYGELLEKNNLEPDEEPWDNNNYIQSQVSIVMKKEGWTDLPRRLELSKKYPELNDAILYYYPEGFYGMRNFLDKSRVKKAMYRKRKNKKKSKE